MDWFKLGTSYYEEPALQRVNDAAEVLFVRSLAYCCHQETNGWVPRQIVPMLTPWRWRGRVAALVREGLWLETEGGWQIEGFRRRVFLNRAHIPDSVRFGVYDRDGWKCVHCDASEPLSLDHIFPWSLGGSDDADNLQTMCIPCNMRKGAKV